MRHFIGLCFVIVLIFMLQACKQRVTNVTIVPDNPVINLQISKLFLARNKLKPNVQVLPSGLQYAVLQTGVGVPPRLNDLVTIYYLGQNIDGQVFDDQHAYKNPVTFRVSSAIPAWQEALQLMQPGAIWVLFAPPQLAYGEKGIPGQVGPNQTVIFNIHLLAIKKM